MSQELILPHNPLWDIPALVQELDARRAQLPSLRVVFTNGCYDLVHPGHVDLLARCKALGDVLIVALNSDASVRSLGKGAERPIVPLDARAFVLSYLASVDYVTSFEESTPYNCISALMPDVLVKGGDWSVENIVGADVVQAAGGEVYSLPLLRGFSTTGIVKKLSGGAFEGT